jgi:hypothetical protein
MSGDVIAAAMAREATRRLVTEPPREAPSRRLAENGRAAREPEPATTGPAADTA